MSSEEALDFGFSVEIDHVRRVVTVTGELDIATTAFLVDAAGSLRAIAPGHVTLDLSGVSFIDAGALGALVGLRRQHAMRGTAFTVIGSQCVVRIAEICGLADLINA
jgi:anti-anti-sigma factor